MTNKAVLICDDHPIFRKGVVNLISGMAGFRVVGEATDVDSAIAKLQIYSPDMLITDLSLPKRSGFELLEWVRGHMSNVRVIVLSMHSELAFIEKARELGAVAHIAKEDASSELLDAMMHDGADFYTSQSVGATSIADPLKQAPKKLDLSRISPAERRVLVLLSESKTSREIATHLNISPRTVETHRYNLAEKLGAKGPNKLLELAIRFADQIRNS
ncbi:MAG: response regulator transcription factor [Nitratireductor sp.]|nr:response regulator transcription factor [Nitratireductor sp.]